MASAPRFPARGFPRLSRSCSRHPRFPAAFRKTTPRKRYENNLNIYEFVSFLTPIWLHFGIILSQFWLPFGSLGGSLEGLRFYVVFVASLGSLQAPFWPDFDSIFATFFDGKSKRFFNRFSEAFCHHVGSIFSSIFVQNRLRCEKDDFLKMSTSCRRELDFRGLGLPKTLQRALQDRSKNRCVFSLKKASKMR